MLSITSWAHNARQYIGTLLYLASLTAFGSFVFLTRRYLLNVRNHTSSSLPYASTCFRDVNLVMPVLAFRANTGAQTFKWRKARLATPCSVGLVLHAMLSQSLPLLPCCEGRHAMRRQPRQRARTSSYGNVCFRISNYFQESLCSQLQRKGHACPNAVSAHSKGPRLGSPVN